MSHCIQQFINNRCFFFRSQHWKWHLAMVVSYQWIFIYFQLSVNVQLHYTPLLWTFPFCLLHEVLKLSFDLLFPSQRKGFFLVCMNWQSITGGYLGFVFGLSLLLKYSRTTYSKGDLFMYCINFLSPVLCSISYQLVFINCFRDLCHLDWWVNVYICCHLCFSLRKNNDIYHRDILFEFHEWTLLFQLLYMQLILLFSLLLTTIWRRYLHIFFLQIIEIEFMLNSFI